MKKKKLNLAQKMIKLYKLGYFADFIAKKTTSTEEIVAATILHYNNTGRIELAYGMIDHYTRKQQLLAMH